MSLSSKDALLATINDVNGLNLTHNQIDFSLPIQSDRIGYNTKVQLTVTQHPQAGGSVWIDYNRENLFDFELNHVVTITAQTPRVQDIVAAFNQHHGFQLTEEDIEHWSQDIGSPTDPVTVTLHAKPDSYAWYGSVPVMFKKA